MLTTKEVKAVFQSSLNTAFQTVKQHLMAVLHQISEFVFSVSATGMHIDTEDNLLNQNCHSTIKPGIFMSSSALFKQQHKNRPHLRGENLQMHHWSALCCALQLHPKFVVLADQQIFPQTCSGTLEYSSHQYHN